MYISLPRTLASLSESHLPVLLYDDKDEIMLPHSKISAKDAEDYIRSIIEDEPPIQMIGGVVDRFMGDGNLREWDYNGLGRQVRLWKRALPQVSPALFDNLSKAFEEAGRYVDTPDKERESLWRMINEPLKAVEDAVWNGIPNAELLETTAIDELIELSDMWTEVACVLFLDADRKQMPTLPPRPHHHDI